MPVLFLCRACIPTFSIVKNQPCFPAQEPGVLTSRDQQLAMKAKQKDDQEPKGSGRGRAKGRGKGKGRGQGATPGDDETTSQKRRKAKSKSDDPATRSMPPSMSKVSASREKPRKGKKQTHNSEAWEADWEDQWVQEWGESWDHESWGSEAKAWDAYAWWDGYSNLSKLAPRKKKREQRGDSAGSGQPDTEDAKAATKKAGHTEDARKKKRKGSNFHDDHSTLPKAKKNAKQQAGEDNEQGQDNGNRKQASGSTGEVKAKKKQKVEGEGNRSCQDPVPKTKKAQTKVLVSFGRIFFGKEDMDKEEVKKLIKADFEKLDQTRLNLYWKRPASGVHVKPVNRDTGYYVFCTDDQDEELQWPVLWAVTAKAAELLASCLYYRNLLHSLW